MLSTVAARSAIDQGLSCFCPPVLISGDYHAPLQLFDLLLDGLLAMGERWRYGGLQVRIPVFRARAEATGADVH